MNSPLLKYLLGFVSLMLVFYAIYTSTTFETYFLNPLVSIQTQVVHHVLNLFGMNTVADGTILKSMSASLNVAKGCDGIEVTFLYLIGVLLMPFPRKSKLVGVLAGLGVLLLLNMLRIVILYLAQIYWPAWFEFLHLHGGFALFTVVAILMWATWANWAMKKEIVGN